MSFSQPSAPGSGIKWDDHKGALLLIEPLSHEQGVKTSYGDADAVEANVHVIEGTGAGISYASTLIFPKLLVSQTKGSIGQKILGRLGQGVAKPGQSAPWLLEESSADDIAKAEKWVAENSPTVTAAAPPF